ncbi:MAG: hypothetical protein ACOYXT_16865 [Bacteroidota bacterium]
MKCVFCCILLCLLAGKVSAQIIEPQPVYYADAGTPRPTLKTMYAYAADPKPQGLRMRNTGRTLTICGVGLMLGGIILMNNADQLYYNAYSSSSGNYEEGDPKGALGLMMTIGGAGMTVPGIILWSKGQKKYDRYLEQQSVSFNLKGTGMSLRYRF